MNQKTLISSTYKSEDTEEWLDKVWTRPIGYLWAKLFEKFGVHPNVVTVLSMVIGASSAFFFYHGSYYYEGTHGLWMNIIGILLLMWANFYDSADGQLARMTGKKTRLGRILDGAASEVWFIPIYLALVARFYNHHSIEFGIFEVNETPTSVWVVTAIMFVCVLYSGFKCHSGQCAMADYYRQIHLLFLKGELGSELDTSAKQQQLYNSIPWKQNIVWKAFLKTYVSYTHKQESRTPNFQKFYHILIQKFGSIDKVPEKIRMEFRKRSLPLMKYTNILTFNTRAIVLYICCLCDVPCLYFIFEIVIMGLLCRYMVLIHEDMSMDMYLKYI